MYQNIKPFGWLTAVLFVSLFFLFSLTACGGTVTDITESPATENMTEDIAPDNSGDNEQPAAPSVPVDTSNLPLLPQMGTGNRGMGGGGVGSMGDSSAEEEMPAGDIMPLPEWNPLADTQFTVNVPFPTDTAVATVYTQPSGAQFTAEEIQRYAQLFGVTGPVYQETLPQFIGEPETSETQAWTPVPSYFIFDGQKYLSFYERTIYYTNQAFWQSENLETLTFAQAAPIAEAFLQERGLLNFPYTVTTTWGSDVEIRRIIDGYPSTSPEFFLSVAANGEIVSITHQPFDQLQALGDYPLRSAADAWQYVQDNGFDYQSSYWFTYPGPDYVPPVALDELPSNPFDDLYRYWPRRFSDGESVTLFTYPLVYTAVNGDAAPRIQIEQYLLNGTRADLEALSAYAGQPVRITGVARGQASDMTIDMTAWEPTPDHEWQYMVGAIRYDGERVLFDTDEGETFIVPSAPDDVVDGERVSLSGWSLEEGDGTYRAFNWASMDRIVDWDWDALPSEETQPVDMPVDSYEITNVVITEIGLTYQFSPIYTEDGLTQLLMQPIWQFKGTTNNNEVIEILIQAAVPELVASEQ